LVPINVTVLTIETNEHPLRFHSAMPSMHGNRIKERKGKRTEREMRERTLTYETNAIFPSRSLSSFTLYRTPDLSFFKRCALVYRSVVVTTIILHMGVAMISAAVAAAAAVARAPTKVTAIGRIILLCYNVNRSKYWPRMRSAFERYPFITGTLPNTRPMNKNL